MFILINTHNQGSITHSDPLSDVTKAPGSIVYAGGSFITKKMVREGIVLNITGLVIITVMCYFILCSNIENKCGSNVGETK